MPNANWSNPTLSSTYTNFVSEVKNRDEDLALQFDGTTSTNLVTNTIRWDSSANRWKKWNGSTWVELTATYALTALTTTGAITAGTSVSGTAFIPLTTAFYTPENGLYSPGSYQVAISTNSVGRLIIDSSGNVNIKGAGTLGLTQAVRFSGSAPVSSMTLDSSGRLGVGNSSPGSFEADANQLVVGSGSGNQGVTIYSGNASQGIIYFADGTTSAQKYTGFISYDHSANAMRFGTNDGAERLRLTSTGALNFVGAGTAGSTQAVSFNGSAPVNSMVLDSSGRVGIGTTSPSQKLHLSESGATALYQRFQNSNGDCYIGLLADGNTVISADSTGDQIVFKTEATERARIDNSGNVLKQYGTALQSYTSGGSVSHMMSYGTWNGTGNLLIVGNTFDGIVFGTGGGTMTEKARIDSSGRLGIGSTGPASRLTIKNPSVTGEQNILSVEAATSSGTLFSLTTNQSDDNTKLFNIVNGPLSFGTNNTERLRIASNGQLSAVVPGNSTLYPGFMVRAWVNFNGSGTVAINASGNVSSITDNGTGDYTVNFTTAMPDTNYAACGFGVSYGTADTRATMVAYRATGTATFTPSNKAAGSARILTGVSSGTSMQDVDDISFSIFR